MGLLNKIRAKNGGLAEFSDHYGYFVYPKLTGLIKNRMGFNGQEVISWSFNDYLGLACDESVIEIETEAVNKYGISYPSGSRLLTGNTDYHEQLEDELSNFTGKDSMILNLGYAGIVSIIQCLVDRNDVIIYDQESHACIIDGAMLHLGTRLSFKHNNINHLEQQLIKAQKTSKGQILVVVDGVYSMGGSLAHLRDIVKLKNNYEFTLMVDDSHGFLVMDHIGTPGYFNVLDQVDIYVSTFGEALGTLGGVVCAHKDFIKHFKYTLRSQVFGRSLSIINVISVLHKLELLKKENGERRAKLWTNTHVLQKGLRDIGFHLGNTESPITPIYINAGTEYASTLVKSLREEHKVFCSGVVYPVITKGQILLRLIPTAMHTDEDISITLNAFTLIKEKLEKSDIAFIN